MARLFREVTTVSLLTGAETAQFGWWWFSPGTPTTSDIVSAIETVTPIWWDGLRDRMHTTTAFQQRELQTIDVDSPYHLIRTDPLTPTANPAGTHAGRVLPPQCSLVVSVRAAAAGSRNRGRFYLPAPAADFLGNDGRVDSTTVTDIVDNLQDYFQACFDAFATAGFDTYLGTFSKTAGAFSVANTIDVGDIIDTQRRRRDALPEARTARSVNL